MKKMLKGMAVIGLLVAASTPAFADYAAISAGVNGFGWHVGGSMESARNAAVSACRTLYGSCSASTSEDVSWWYAAGACNGVPYTGATPQGPGRARAIISMKGNADGNYDCEVWGVKQGYDMYQ